MVDRPSRAYVRHTIELTPEQQDFICDQIVIGVSVKDICFKMGLNPTHLYDYAFKDPIFDKNMNKARVYNSHLLVDELLKCTEGAETIAQTQKARVWSDNAKWVASKMNPKQYGENLNVNVSHHLDLSSILLAAENRVIPILKAKNALNAPSPENSASYTPQGEAIDVEYAPSPQPIAPAAPDINELNVAGENIPDTQQPALAAVVAADAIGAIEIPKEWI